MVDIFCKKVKINLIYEDLTVGERSYNIICNKTLKDIKK